MLEGIILFVVFLLHISFVTIQEGLPLLISFFVIIQAFEPTTQPIFYFWEAFKCLAYNNREIFITYQYLNFKTIFIEIIS